MIFSFIIIISYVQSKVSDEEDVSEKEHKEKEDSQREKEESDCWCYFS